MAASKGPCLRVSQGRVPVSANAALARLPASHAALANSTEPNVPGGRNTTWPSARCGASALAMSACAVAGAGQRISSAPRTASPMSPVISAGFASWRPRKSLTVMSPPAALCASIAARSRRHRLHLVAGERQVTGCRQRAIATAQDGYSHLLFRSVVCGGALPPGCAFRDQLLRAEVLHLAQGVARQLAHEHVLPRHLVARQLRRGKTARSRRRRARPRTAQHDIGDRHLLPFLVGAADHGGLGDGRMLAEHALHLGWIDVLAAGYDHVLLAVVDVEMSRRRRAWRCRRCGTSPRAASRRWLWDCANTRRARWGRAPRSRRRCRPAARHRCRRRRALHRPSPAVRSSLGLRQSPDSSRVDRDGRGFRGPVELEHRDAAVGDGIDEALRHLRGAGGDGAQAVELGLRPARVLDHCLDGGRHQHRQGRPVASRWPPAWRPARSARAR